MKDLELIYSRDTLKSMLESMNLQEVRKDFNLPKDMDLFDMSDYISISNIIRANDNALVNAVYNETLRDQRHKIISKYVCPPCSNLSFRKGVI